MKFGITNMLNECMYMYARNSRHLFCILHYQQDLNIAQPRITPYHGIPTPTCRATSHKHHQVRIASNASSYSNAAREAATTNMLVLLQSLGDRGESDMCGRDRLDIISFNFQRQLLQIRNIGHKNQHIS